MKNSINKISMVAFMALSLVSCKKYLDINENPNNALIVEPKLLFNNAVTHLFNNRAGGDLFIPMALGGQSMAGGGSSTDGVSWGSASEDQYVFSAFSYSNIWAQYYTSVAFNLKNAIKLCENPGGSLAPNNNGAAQSKVILAETFYELATIYGDVPFSEALNDSILEPHFDSQEQVLNGAIGLLDEALAQFDPEAEFLFTEEYDMIYGGDIEKWIRAARSLKLRMLFTMVDKDPSKASAIGEMMAEGNFISSADDNMKVKFENVAGRKNPKYAIIEQYNGGMNFFYASPYVIDYMNADNDPRRPIFFERPAGQPNYVGILPGDDADDAVNAKINPDFHYADEPEYLFTYQEQLFFEAEAYARGFVGGSPNLTMANTLYKQALVESALFFGVASGDANTFASARPALTAISNPLTAIHYEHWIDLMDRGVDAFTQWRRSGPEGSEVPALDVPVNAPSGGLFRRYEYPANSETAANPNAPELIRFTVKTWFDL